MAQERKPFDWEGFVTWLEQFFPLFLRVLRLFVGIKNLKNKIREYEVYVTLMEKAKAAAEEHENEQ